MCQRHTPAPHPGRGRRRIEPRVPTWDRYRMSPYRATQARTPAWSRLETSRGGPCRADSWTATRTTGRIGPRSGAFLRSVYHRRAIMSRDSAVSAASVSIAPRVIFRERSEGQPGCEVDAGRHVERGGSGWTRGRSPRTRREQDRRHASAGGHDFPARRCLGARCGTPPVRDCCDALGASSTRRCSRVTSTRSPRSCRRSRRAGRPPAERRRLPQQV